MSTYILVSLRPAIKRNFSKIVFLKIKTVWVECTHFSLFSYLENVLFYLKYADFNHYSLR